MVLKSVLLRGKKSCPVKQILEPQQSADTFVKRVLVANHGIGQLCGWNGTGVVILPYKTEFYN